MSSAASNSGSSRRRSLLQHWSRPGQQTLLSYLLLAPAVLLVGAIILYPLLLALDLSFQDVKIPRLNAPRNAFTYDNYIRLARSQEFWQSSLTTVKLVVTVTTACLAMGIGTALLVNNRFRGRSLARVLVTLPWAVPELIAAVLFAWIFDSSYGLMNWFLVSAGLSDIAVRWLSQPTAAFFAVAFTMVWKGYPFVCLMVLAGLQSIPPDLYRAARVDGANTLQRFRYITLPMLRPVVGVTAILVILWVFRDFSIIYVLTGGGPINATQTLSIMTYQEAFSNFRMGYASAIGIVTLILCLLISMTLVGRKSHAVY